ncbi:MAG: c-type cytochrome [Gammaproteobacteria bacterium]|nr:c-type cytochrome [Gammaproteobacteria bacterium]
MNRNFFKQLFILIISVYLVITIAIALASQKFEPITPLTPLPEESADKVKLGKKLFHETKLSKNNTIACVSCHNLHNGGVDGLQFSVGINGTIGRINAPTVFNSGYSIAQFWDARASSLEDQVFFPIHDDLEMGSNWKEVISKLSAVPDYVHSFKSIYKKEISRELIQDAIASFERSLVTLDSPFDLYLKGNDHAISVKAKKGYDLFKSYGCISCHHGRLVGGNMYEKMGLIKNYFDKDDIKKEDLGRFNVTGKENHKHEFKVPSLRNIELTAPYFHDGSSKTLANAVSVMGRFQLGRNIPEQDISLIVSFLKSLTGKLPASITTNK